MNRFQQVAIAAVISFSSLFSIAHAADPAPALSDGWIRGSVPGQKNGAGYVVINNPSSNEMQLTSAQSDRAERVELHTIVREDGVAKMREVSSIPVPANGSVKLQPGGYHIMFIGIKQPFTSGETVPVTLNFAGQKPVIVEFKVQPPTYQPAGQSHMMKGMNH